MMKNERTRQAHLRLPDDVPAPAHVATDARDDARADGDNDFLPYAVTFGTFGSAPRETGLAPLLADLLTADIARTLKPKGKT